MIDWRHWHNEPYLVGGLIVAAWLHALAAGPFRASLAPPGTPYPRAQAMRFHAGLLVFYLAVGSPLDQIGERFLFSAHMLQHQLLIYPAAILFLLGLPGWMADAVIGRLPLLGLVRLLFKPLVCGLVFSIVTSVWHMPGLYDWALQDKFVHVVEHLTFFGVALLYWWPLLSPSRILPASTYAAQMLHVFAVVVWMTPVFAYIVFTREPLYPTYEFAPRVVADFSPIDDQLLAGSAMKLVGLAVALASFGWSFYRWSQTEGGGRRGARVESRESRG